MIQILQTIVLAIVQGLAELLPISSSAHVVVAAKLMGLNPTSPEMTLLLVMLHTGTMFAVIAYFWKNWQKSLFANAEVFKRQATRLVVATAITGVIGEGIIKVIEKIAAAGHYVPVGAGGKVDVEELFGNLILISIALAAAGVLILVAGLRERRDAENRELTVPEAGVMGLVQALVLPFRGFSRSGATISTGMLAGVAKQRVEEFSFALAVLLTPAVVGREVWRLAKFRHAAGGAGLTASAFGPSLLGMCFAFFAGLVALKWLSSWLENGRWYWFGIYCLGMAAVVGVLYTKGY